MDLDAIHSSVEAMEDYAEEYLFGRLLPADRTAYEEHILVCEECRSAVEKTEQFIKRFRQALEEGPIQ